MIGNRRKYLPVLHIAGTSRTRRGFTLIEVMLAAVVAAFVLAALATTMSQLGRLRETSSLRLSAYLRAEAALNNMRRDIASVIRNEDLFWTRLVVREGVAGTPIGELMRDEILVFSTRLLSMQDLDFSGEGTQYEVQYRVEETPYGAMLWQRRDPVPDENPFAGGIATPLVEGIVELFIEVYDGYEWTSQWDSDELGLPLAVRITVAASGSRSAEELYEGPIVQLRAVVPIDRVISPSDRFRPTDDELEELLAEAEDVSDISMSAQNRGRGGTGRSAPGRDGRGMDGRGGRGMGARPGMRPGGQHPGRQPGQPGGVQSPRGSGQPGGGGFAPQPITPGRGN